MRKFVIMFVCMVLLTACKNKPNDEKAYSDISSEIANKWELSYDQFLESESPKYVYEYDVDQNGVPELFLGWDAEYRVMATFINDSVEETVPDWYSSFGCKLYLVKDKKMVLASEVGGHTTGTDQFERHTFYLVSDDGFKKDSVYESNVSADGKFEYKLDGVIINKEMFDKACKNITELPKVRYNSVDN